MADLTFQVEGEAQSAAKGYRLILTMPESMSIERRKIPSGRMNSKAEPA